MSVMKNAAWRSIQQCKYIERRSLKKNTKHATDSTLQSCLILLPSSSFRRKHLLATSSRSRQQGYSSRIEPESNLPSTIRKSTSVVEHVLHVSKVLGKPKSDTHTSLVQPQISSSTGHVKARYGLSASASPAAQSK
jgi:hypothetical protein